MIGLYQKSNQTHAKNQLHRVAHLGWKTLAVYIVPEPEKQVQTCNMEVAENFSVEFKTQIQNPNLRVAEERELPSMTVARGSRAMGADGTGFSKVSGDGRRRRRKGLWAMKRLANGCTFEVDYIAYEFIKN